MTDENNVIPVDSKLIEDDKENNNGNSKHTKEEVIQEKKRKREETMKAKRLMEEEYNHQLQDQQYKRLMHLLNRSKFYASYIVNKINDGTENQDKNKPSTKKSNVTNENPPTQAKRKIGDLRQFISVDVQKKLHVRDTKKTNLSEEQIESELNKNSDNRKEVDDFEIPKYFNGVLRNYQKEGLQWLKVLYENGINGILADEMGLGKTIQVIALLCHLIEKQQGGPFLIIAPLSTIPNWMIEFERFAPTLPVIIFHGDLNTRLPARRKIKEKHKIAETSFSTFPVVLTTFEIPLMENAFLRTQKWRYIIIDEGHRIKNHKCALVKVLRTFTSMNRLLLTGTPLQNNLAELWSLLNFLLPEIFNDLAVFESWFDAKELQYDEGTKKFLELEKEKHVLASLREILQPFMLRREKTDVCLDIPPKKEVIIYAPLSDLQHDLYMAVINREIDKLTKVESENLILETENGERPKRKCSLRSTDLREDGTSSNSFQENSNDGSDHGTSKSRTKKELSIWKKYTNINDDNQEFFIHVQMRNRLVMFKKILNHPYLVYCPLDQYGFPKIDEKLVQSSGKFLALDAMLPKLKAGGHRILLFSTMTTILDMIEYYLQLRNYKWVRLDGTTKLEDRKENINQFDEDPSIFIFLISTRAGGVGLNLAAADTVIMFDSDWNPQADIQAMARCHRIGQTRPVVIYILCTKGTIDEVIINRADTKRILEKMVISKNVKSLNVNNKQTLIELQKLLGSKPCKITSGNEVFTMEQIDELLDRSDLYAKTKSC